MAWIWRSQIQRHDILWGPTLGMGGLPFTTGVLDPRDPSLRSPRAEAMLLPLAPMSRRDDSRAVSGTGGKPGRHDAMEGMDAFLRISWYMQEIRGTEFLGEAQK